MKKYRKRDNKRNRNANKATHKVWYNACVWQGHGRTRGGCFMGTMVAETSRIRKFLFELGEHFLSSVPMKHMISLLSCITSVGFSGKTTQIEQFSQNHRTNISHFWRAASWVTDNCDAVSDKHPMSMCAKKLKNINPPCLSA